MPSIMYPTEDQIKSFVTACGYQPQMNYLFVFEEDTLALEARRMEGSLHYQPQPYLLLFTNKELLIKWKPSQQSINSSNYQKNLTRIPNDKITNFSTNAYEGKYHISFQTDEKKYEFCLSMHYKLRMKYSDENYQKLLQQGFYGLFEPAKGPIEENSPGLVRYLKPFTSGYFIFSTFLGLYAFHLRNVTFAIAALLAMGAMLLVYKVGTNPAKWTRQDRLVQAACGLMDLVSFLLLLFSVVSST